MVSLLFQRQFFIYCDTAGLLAAAIVDEEDFIGRCQIDGVAGDEVADIVFRYIVSGQDGLEGIAPIVRGQGNALGHVFADQDVAAEIVEKFLFADIRDEADGLFVFADGQFFCFFRRLFDIAQGFVVAADGGQLDGRCRMLDVFDGVVILFYSRSCRASSGSLTYLMAQPDWSRAASMSSGDGFSI